jgi:hypothetical protein
MRDMVEQTPNERDEAIYAAWESGKKTLRGLAREFGCSVPEIGLAIDRCLPPFNTQTQMRRAGRTRRPPRAVASRADRGRGGSTWRGPPLLFFHCPTTRGRGTIRLA